METTTAVQSSFPEFDQQLTKAQSLNDDCLSLWASLSSFLNNDKTSFVFPTLMSLSFSEPYLRFTYGCKEVQWQGFAAFFAQACNFFNDPLPEKV